MPYKYGSRKFKSSEFADPVPFDTAWIGQLSYRDPEHSPEYCLVCAGGPIQNGEGLWKLRQAINIASLMPDAVSDRKVIEVVSKGSSQWSFGAITAYAWSYLSVLGDNAQIWKSSQLSHVALQDYAKNLFSELNLSVDDYTTLDINLQQKVVMALGWAAVHDYDITISYSYYTDVIPSTGDVEITIADAESGVVLKGFSVRLMQSTKLIRTGVTDSSGKVTWSGVEEGDYTIQVLGVQPTLWSAGYSDLEDTVKVEPSVTNSFVVRLASIPKSELPWYAWAGIGVAVIGGAVVYFRRPLAPAVTIIREKVPYAIKKFKRGYGAEDEE